MDPKAHILNAAQTVFARHGFRQTAMATVAEEAHLSRQALYHHFASKEALFATLVDALQDRALGAAKAAAARPVGTAADAIFAVMIAYHETLVSRLSGSPFAAELIEESGRQCGAAVAAYARRFEKELEALCARLVREGRLTLRAGVSARDLVEMVTTAAKGVKAVHMADGGARYGRALQRMIRVICAGVEAAPRRAASAARPQQSRKVRGRIAR